MSAREDGEAADRSVQEGAEPRRGRTLQTNDRAPLSDRKDDLYETPPEAVRALLVAEKLPEYIWEPACGPGAIVAVLLGAGHLVYASDLIDYGCPSGAASRVDFLMERELPLAKVGGIVTNPPFKLAAAFVEHACELCPYVAMLLRLE